MFMRLWKHAVAPAHYAKVQFAYCVVWYFLETKTTTTQQSHSPFILLFLTFTFLISLDRSPLLKTLQTGKLKDTCEIKGLAFACSSGGVWLQSHLKGLSRVHQNASPWHRRLVQRACALSCHCVTLIKVALCLNEGVIFPLRYSVPLGPPSLKEIINIQMHSVRTHVYRDF